MKVMRPMLKPGEVEFFLKLHGLWEGLVRLPRPPPPPFDIETLRRIEPPWQPKEVKLSDGRILLLDES